MILFSFHGHAKLLQSCLTFCDPMDCCLPSSSVHGILLARIFEWVVHVLLQGSSWPRDWTCGVSGKELGCQCVRRRRYRFDLWVRTIPEGGHGKPLQYSCQENPRDRGAWRAMVHRVAKNRTWLKWLST